MSKPAFNRIIVARVIMKDGSERRILAEHGGLRIAFEAEKTIQSNPNDISITFYNLNAESRAQIESETNKVELYAGYVGHGFNTTQLQMIVQDEKVSFPGLDDSIFLITSGQIHTSESEHTGTDWKTMLATRDGQEEESQDLSGSWGPDTPLSTIVEDVAKKITGNNKTMFKAIYDVVVNAVATSAEDGEGEGGFLDKVTNIGIAFAGKASDLMDELTKSGNMNWSIQDGQFQLSAKGKPLDPPVGAKVYTFQNGLLKAPHSVEVHFARSKPIKGSSARTIIDPWLIPAYRFSAEGHGDQQIIRANISGDTHSDEWYADLEMRGIT